MKQLSVLEWWSSLTPRNKQWCKDKYFDIRCASFTSIAYGIHYLQEKPFEDEPQFKAGQELWYKNEKVTYLYPSPNREGMSYVIKGPHYQIVGKSSLTVKTEDLATIQPIKKDTPVLCWNEGDSRKRISLYHHKMKNDHMVSDYPNSEYGDCRYDYVEVYKPK